MAAESRAGRGPGKLGMTGDRTEGRGGGLSHGGRRPSPGSATLSALTRRGLDPHETGTFVCPPSPAKLPLIQRERNGQVAVPGGHSRGSNVWTTSEGPQLRERETRAAVCVCVRVRVCVDRPEMQSQSSSPTRGRISAGCAQNRVARRSGIYPRAAGSRRGSRRPCAPRTQTSARHSLLSTVPFPHLISLCSVLV